MAIAGNLDRDPNFGVGCVIAWVDALGGRGLRTSWP